MPQTLGPSLKIALIAVLGVLTSCRAQSMEGAPKLRPTTPEQFRSFWDQGKAEVTSYELEQARYGELHQGHSVLIFVREDFSLKKHVKLDAPRKAGSDAVSVLKLNATLKFTTGIYPYSVMQSVFTPTARNDQSATLKVTTSSQEWCGHVFSQLDLADDGFSLATHSYFESEGDSTTKLPLVPLEDELWNLIRIDPSALPLGSFDIIPGGVDARLRHRKPGAARVQASLRRASFEGQELLAYQLSYETVRRELTVFFDESFPHEILGWEETLRKGSGPDATSLTTRAKRKKSLLIDYWAHNHVADLKLRRQLGLD